jgi:acetate---CoA ligase (ADP-forming)
VNRFELPPSLSNAQAKVEALLNPRNIVIVGASDAPGSWALRAFQNLRRYDFPGPIYPLNPRRDRVWDARCYRSFAELPEPPDHLLVVIPAPLVPDMLREAARAGARSATVMSSGFGESQDQAAQALSEKLNAVIAETGLAVSGPNCMGNIHAPSQLMTLTDDRPHHIAPGGLVALVGQSGGLVMAIKRTLDERGIVTASLVTSGNEAGLCTADYIAYFARQPHIKVIISYLETVRDADRFLAACRTARDAGKPVVVVKLGASVEGRAAALAHTGALAGATEAFDAVAGAAGAIRVRTLDDLVEVAEYFTHLPLPGSARLGGITFSGALRGLLLDGAAANGLKFLPLAPATRQRLEAVLGVGSIVGNPLDSGFAGVGNNEIYVACVEAMLDDPAVDILLLQEELPRGPGSDRKEANLHAVNALAAKTRKPMVFFSMISHGLTDYSRALRKQLPHIAFLQEVDKTMRAVRAVATYAERVATPATAVAAGAKAKLRLEKLLGRAQCGAGRTTLNEVDSKALLRAYGIRCPQEGIVRSEKEAVALAERIGYPVVAKAVSAALAHKSDVGGVMLGLNSARSVRAAYQRLTTAVARRAGGIDGVLIAEQMANGVEFLLGANRDPDIGPVILFGAGGVDLELTRDVALAAPPLDERNASDLIERTRVGRIVAGYRGRAALDRKALVKALIGLSQLVADSGSRIESIDVNPFLLRPRGGFALDGLVVLSGKA